MIGMPLEFQVLGPLEVRSEGVALSTGGMRQRALLALLLLSANRVVARDRLIEELSRDRRGPMSDHALRVQISRLRRALSADEGRLVARAPGYVLRVEPGELDLHDFERLATDGRQALQHGDRQRAAELLREAESLWRGRPLADLEFEPSARLEIERLEELRLSVVELRIDAELALGRHAALVGELESFVAHHPLRELGREQLMLALYRSGRQIEALDHYRAARAKIAEELGLHPSSRLRELEQSILRQDAALELPATTGTAVVERAPEPDSVPCPPPRDPTATFRRASRWRRWLFASVAAIIAGVAAVASGTLGGDGTIEPVNGDGVVGVSAHTGKPLAFVALDAPPTHIVPGFGSLWMTQYDAGTVSEVDPHGPTVRQTLRVGDGPSGLAVAAGDIWIANSLDGTVSRIDAETRTVVQTIAVGIQPSAVAASDDAVWVTNRVDGTVSRLDAVNGRVTARVRVGRGPNALAVDGDSLWVANQDAGTVSRVNTHGEQVVQTVHVGDAPAAIVVVPSGVWVADSLDSTVSRIDPARGVVTSTIAVRGTPDGIMSAAGSIWVTGEDGGVLARIDPARGAVIARSRVGARTGPVVFAAGKLWVGTKAGGPPHRGGTLTVLDAFASTQSIDPATGTGTPLQTGLTNDGLVTLNHVAGPAGAQVVPDLAIAVPRPSEDGRTYVFRLRPGIRYSTGQTVRPTDVRRSFERIFELRAPPAVYYEPIVGARACLARRPCDLSAGIVANDRDGTVTFHLTEPSPEFLYLLTHISATVLPASTPSREAHAPLPATGPYRISSYRPGHEIRFIRNPYFRLWSPSAQPIGFPDRIVVRQGVAPSDAATLIERGRADLMTNFSAAPPGHRDLLRTRFPRQLRVHVGLATTFEHLNTRAPPFDDLRVRRALNYGIDRDRLVQILGGPGSAQPTCQILPPQMPGYRRYCPYTRDPRADGRWSGPDIRRARQLVAASGTAGMRVGVWAFDAPVAFGREGGRYITSVLRRLGYRATLHMQQWDRSLHYTMDSRNRAQVIAADRGAAWPSASNFIGGLSCSFFTPKSPTNVNGSEFCDPAIDRQIFRAMALQPRDPARAYALWAHLDRELTDRAVWLPLVTPKTTDVISKRVGNYQYHPTMGVFVDQLWVR
jgi:YVTN family beta-propeller protein